MPENNNDMESVLAHQMLTIKSLEPLIMSEAH